MVLYGKYGHYGFVWLWYGLLWILVCTISRVYLGIHLNPRFLQSWVGKTLVVYDEYGFLVYDVRIHVWVLGS